VSAISPFTYDSFARVVAAGSWGTADSGKAWTLAGGTDSERSVDGTYALVNLPSSPSTIRFQLQPGEVGDCEIRASLSADQVATTERDRKSTRLNSSHVKISYAVFCLT